MFMLTLINFFISHQIL